MTKYHSQYLNNGVYSPFTIYHILIIPLDTVTGGLAAGPIAGIVIGAVVFVILHLILIAVIVYYIYLRSKKWKSTFIVCENNHTNDGDLQAEYRQLERSQSYAQPFDAERPKDSTHSDNQSNAVSQNSDRRRFLKREVRRILERDCTFTAKTKLLFQLSIWLPQLHDYPYYAMQSWKRIHAVGADT